MQAVVPFDNTQKQPPAKEPAPNAHCMAFASGTRHNARKSATVLLIVQSSLAGKVSQAITAAGRGEAQRLSAARMTGVDFFGTRLADWWLNTRNHSCSHAWSRFQRHSAKILFCHRVLSRSRRAHIGFCGETRYVLNLSIYVRGYCVSVRTEYGMSNQARPCSDGRRERISGFRYASLISTPPLSRHQCMHVE
jgi:hypothetical protein